MNFLPKQSVWRLWAVIMILVIIAAVIRIWNALTIVPEHITGWLLVEEVVNWLILFPLAAPAFATAGVVILARHPGNLIAWLCVATGIILVFQDIFWQFTLRAAADGWPGVAPLAILTVWFSAPNIPPLTLIILLLRFPNGQLLSSRWRWIEGLAIASTLAQVLAGTFYTELTIGLPDPMKNPIGIAALEEVLSFAINAGVALSMTSLGLALVAMLIRRWRAVGQERQQLKWLAFASGWLLVFVLLTFLLYTVNQAVGTLLYIVMVAIGTIGIPTALGIAMLRYRLYDVDLVINRALVYSILTAVLGVVYAGSVMLLQGTSRLLTGDQSSLAIVTSSLFIAALFTPLRRRIQIIIDRRFYRQRYDAAQVLAAFSAVARDEVDLQRLKDRLLDVIAETMQPAHLSLWLRESGDNPRHPES